MNKNPERTPDYEQVLIGEKIKEILRQQYQKKSITENSYKRHAKDGTVILFLTWSTHNFASVSSTFLANNFLVKQEKMTGPMNDKDLFAIYLGDVLRNTQAVTRLNNYYKKNCSGVISENSIDGIISRMQVYEIAPVDKKEELKSQEQGTEEVVVVEQIDDANVSVEKAEVVVEQIEDINAPVENAEEVVAPLEKVETVEEANVETKADAPSSEPIQKAKEPQKKKLQKENVAETKAPEVNSVASRSLSRFKDVLKIFFKNQSFFEKKFDASAFKDINSLFAFGDESEYIQLITCLDEDNAFLIEKMAKWHVDDYKGQNLVKRDGVHLSVDASVFIKVGNPTRSTAGSFCLPPSNGASLDEIKQRLHRVRYLGDFTLKQGTDCFAVRYKTIESTNNIFYLVSISMGWKVELKDNCFIIFTGPNPVLPDVSDFAEFKKPAENNKPVITPKTDGTATYSVRVRRTDSDKSLKKNQTPKANPPEEKVSADSIPVEKSEQNAPEPESHKPLSIKDLFEKDEVLIKLQEIYDNEDHWDKISDDNKKKVISVLRIDLKNGNPENFAYYLLNLESEDRPLYSKEEATEEFRTMYTNPNFSDSYKAETQDKIKVALKKHFVNSDPDNFVTNVIDLFV